MRYIKEKASIQIEINKSVFIAVFHPLESQDDIYYYLDQIKHEYPKANHYCSASIYGEHGEQQTAHDDGEPSRTAGIPILEVLKHHDVTNILCVVVRFFGGIKLGSGGLVRAYTKATADLIKDVKFYQKKYVHSYELEFDYPLINLIDHYLENKATVLEKNFLTTVTYKIIFNEDDASVIADIKHQLIDLKQLSMETSWIEA